MTVWESFRDGGWGMWFILVFGVLTVAASARFAARGDHRLVPFIRWMTLTTGSSALLGFFTGMIAVFNYVVNVAPAPERVVTLFQGTKEALNCITLGLIMTTLACLLSAIGHRRFPAPT